MHNPLIYIFLEPSQELSPTCSICLEQIVSGASTPICCNDVFHKTCIEEWLVNGDGSAVQCPICSKTFSKVVDVSNNLSFPTQNDLKSILPEACISPNEQSNSLDYTYLQQQYGALLEVDESKTSPVCQGDNASCPFEIFEDENAEEELLVPVEGKKQSFEEDLRALSADKVKLEEENSYIWLKVRRTSIWKDTKLKLERLKDISKLSNAFVKVQFVGEAAVDEGGPKRELFSLLHKEISQSNLFIGEETGSKCFAHDLSAALCNDYFFYGICCALAIINGAVGPQFFCSPVVDYILSGNIRMVRCAIDNIPNKSVRNKLQHLMIATDDSTFDREISTLVKELPDDILYTKCNRTLKNKTEILNCIIMHYIISQNLCEISQFVEGLRTFGVLDTLRCHPNEARSIFQASEVVLTAKVVDALFNFELSPEGSNRNRNEKAILFNWCQFLEDVEHGLATIEVCNPRANEQVQVEITLKSVIAFVTGSSGIPPLGFTPKPKIVFDHVNINKKLHVSTCSNTLYFPVSEILLTYEQFKNDFIYCMSNSPGFGLV